MARRRSFAHGGEEHRMPGAWQVYDHYDYLPEQAKAYEAWAVRLAQITDKGQQQ
jgi:hypothetical protein